MFPQSSRTDERSRQALILLVEDEPFVREATESILKSAGFAVLAAADARAALTTYAETQEHIELVITDMVLPGCTGQELGRELRQRSSRMKILITSGYGTAASELEEPARETYFLAKPYSRRSLVEKVETILGGVPLACVARQAG